MNYQLNQEMNNSKSSWRAARSLLGFLSDEKSILIISGFVTVASAAANLVTPLIIAYIIDTYIVTKDFSGVIIYGGILFILYVVGLVANYVQTRLMGGIGQRVLYKLRNALFNKLQELPVAFFDVNKTGDLISRVNNDTDKLNQFFSQTLMRTFSGVMIMFGAALFMLVLNFKLAAAALLPAALLLLLSNLVAPWVRKTNAEASQATGNLSAEVSESIANFKVTVAFNRRDFFRENFARANETNYKTSIWAGIANNTYAPAFQFASHIAQLVVLVYGMYLISSGELTIGLLIGFLVYVSNFYDPLKQLAALWANFQVAMAGWNRISVILLMQNAMKNVSLFEQNNRGPESTPVIEFKNVSFGYVEGKPVLSDINIELHEGRTYALVGPTGGGKTTTALLMARLYDPTTGQVLLNGQDIREYSNQTRTKKISFILQEPILFSGTIRDNLLYGNETYADCSDDEFTAVIKNHGLESLLNRFEGGLATKIESSNSAISLGQKQLISFMRSILREPDVLILDEATANIDTVTEQILENVLEKLPKKTTRVIIAHRLNTIENANEILFVNCGKITNAGSMGQALEMLKAGVRGG